MYNHNESYSRLGVATLNQWAMDFEHNKKNIIKSIEIAKQIGCTYRLGPELEVCGYGCEDHFLENDTVQHCWDVLFEILDSDLSDDMIVDIGMPVTHKNVLYNCRIICFDRQIKLIRPKLILADDGNYRESRWFTPWAKNHLEDYPLPHLFKSIRNQVKVPFGVAILKTLDTEIGLEICEEMFVPQPTSTQQCLDGAEIIVNSSGSHFEINKLTQKVNLILDITKRNGAVYLYSNLRGCDGSRLYYDGLSMIACNGHILKKSDVFSLKDVEITFHDVDLSRVRNHRINLKSRSQQASKQNFFPRVDININMSRVNFIEEESKPLLNIEESVGKQIIASVAAYLWDYLRRSGASGFFLPLSGGIDSAASAICVFHMCERVFLSLQNREDIEYQQVLSDLRRIVDDNTFIPNSSKDIMKRLFSTAYLQCSNSSDETKTRSRILAEQIGSQHYELDFDEVFQSLRNCIKPIFNQEPKFQSEGGKDGREDLALQNIQARTRMVLSYLLAQLTPWNNGKKGFYLVLGSSNLDESLRGYLTKYDCSSADLNPLGSITKNDIKNVLLYTHQNFNIEIIPLILSATVSAELRPAVRGTQQSSIEEMEMDFDDLETFGKLRKNERLGPLGMFRRLLPMWPNLSATEIARKIKKFFMYYAQNRHKQVVQTPSFHVEGHSNDDNRYDLRQIVYNWRWPFQFQKIDEAALKKEQYDSVKIRQ